MADGGDLASGDLPFLADFSFFLSGLPVGGPLAVNTSSLRVAFFSGDLYGESGSLGSVAGM